MIFLGESNLLHLGPRLADLLRHLVANDTNDPHVQLPQFRRHLRPERLNQPRRALVNRLAELLVDVVGVLLQQDVLRAALDDHRHHEGREHRLAHTQSVLEDVYEPLVAHIGAKLGGHAGEKGLWRLVHSGRRRYESI